MNSPSSLTAGPIHPTADREDGSSAQGVLLSPDLLNYLRQDCVGDKNRRHCLGDRRCFPVCGLNNNRHYIRLFQV